MIFNLLFKHSGNNNINAVQNSLVSNNALVSDTERELQELLSLIHNNNTEKEVVNSTDELTNKLPSDLILESSNFKIKQMIKFVFANTNNVIDKYSPDVVFNEQFMEIEGKFYYMPENKWAELRKSILLLPVTSNAETITRLANRTEPIQINQEFLDILEQISKTILNNQVTKLLDVTAIIKLVVNNNTRVLADLIIKALQTRIKIFLVDNKSNFAGKKFSMNITNLCTNIGELLFTNYFLNTFHDDHEKVTFMFDNRKSFFKFKELLNLKYSKDILLLLQKDLNNNHNIEGYLSSMAKSIAQQGIFPNQYYSNDDLHICFLCMYIREYLSVLLLEDSCNESILKNTNIVELRGLLQNIIDKVTFKIGSLIIQTLIDEKFLLEEMSIEDTNIYVSRAVYLPENIILALQITAADNKPLLSPNTFNNNNKTLITSTEGLTIKINADIRSIHNKPEYVCMYKQKLKDLLSPEYNTFCIAKPHFKCFIEYIDDLHLNGSFEDKILFCTHIYTIDFKAFLQKNQDVVTTTFLTKLINFGADLTIVYEPISKSNKTLKEQLKDSPLIEIYNRIIGIKDYVIKLLNDVNLYKDFNFFNIEKFIVYVGRIFSSTYTLQLQGSKLAYAFIAFRNIGTLIETEETYKKVYNAYASQIDPIFLQMFKQFNTFEKYKAHTKKIHFQFIKSQFNNCDNPEITKIIALKAISLKNAYKEGQIPVKELIKELTPYTKIGRKFFSTLFSLVHLYNPDLRTEPIIQEDATSSGFQMIAILFRDHHAATISNLIGDSYHNLYLQQLIYFRIKRQKALRIMEYVNTILGKSPTFASYASNMLYSVNDTESFKQNIIALSEFLLSVKDLNINTEIDNINLKLVFNIFCVGLFDTSTKKFIKNLNTYVQSVVYMLLITFQYTKFLQMLKENAWIEDSNIFENRSLVKTQCIGIIYGQGFHGCCQTFESKLKELAFASGTLNINLRVVSHLGLILTAAFTQNIKYNYPIVKTFNDFVGVLIMGPKKGELDSITYDSDIPKNISDRAIPIKEFGISTEFLHWTLAPHETKILKLDMRTLKKGAANRHRQILRINKPTIDAAALLLKIRAIMAHSMDASIVHEVLDVTIIAARTLRESGVYNNYAFNHDCFAYPKSHIVFLRPIVGHAYKKIYDENFLHKFITNYISKFASNERKDDSRYILNQFLNNKSPLQMYDGVPTNPNWLRF